VDIDCLVERRASVLAVPGSDRDLGEVLECLGVEVQPVGLPREVDGLGGDSPSLVVLSQLGLDEGQAPAPRNLLVEVVGFGGLSRPSRTLLGLVHFSGLGQNPCLEPGYEREHPSICDRVELLIGAA
jgi:hypothetical protein